MDNEPSDCTSLDFNKPGSYWKVMHRILSLIGTICLFSLISHAEVAARKPNFVIIMVDDMGYSDLGCFGSEIDTPNLDRLASNGLRFNQFYNTAKCHSSRVSLLTGQYCIAAGDTALSNAVTSAEVLGNAGYFTAMTGKWHLKQEPTDFGFERYFGHLSGACNYFSGDDSFRLNGSPWKVPDNGFYTTVANVDYALRFLQEARQTGKPWYLYIAFNAPHAPLHALPDDYRKYKGRYDAGWDVMRAERVEKQKRIGLLPSNLKESPRPEHIPEWQAMEPWRQEFEANRMTTLAAMIDRVDQEVGRLVSNLKANNELDNTLILFVSDNGACPYDRKNPVLDVEPTSAGISLPDSTGWAWARNSPFRYYKQNQFEGGISSPAIVHWPAGLKTVPGSVVDQPAHLIDVLPTLADIAGCAVPDAWPGRELRPVSGVSLKPIFDGQSLGERPPIHLLFSTDRGLRDGDWKLVSFRQEAWELYNMGNDRTELNDLARQELERLKRMVDTWTDMAKNVLHAQPKSYAPVTEAMLPHTNPQWTDFGKTDESLDSTSSRKRNPSRAMTIRARKNTKLQTVGNELRLEFTGDDPGIAIDMSGLSLFPGPYLLTFSLLEGSKQGGEVFYTIDPKTTLPRGERLEFSIAADGKWQPIAVELPTDMRIYQLRVDVSPGPGKAVIKDLKLCDSGGKVLISWPQDKSSK